jgi:hypothetical protein
MPELSRFYGIVIKMYFGDHEPPHFHAEYGGDEMVVGIKTLAVIQGRLSPRAMGMVLEWAALHQTELMADWQLAKSALAPRRIAPLP